MFPALPDSLSRGLSGVSWVDSGAIKAAGKMDEDGKRHRWGRSSGGGLHWSLHPARQAATVTSCLPSSREALASLEP